MQRKSKLRGKDIDIDKQDGEKRQQPYTYTRPITEVHPLGQNKINVKNKEKYDKSIKHKKEEYQGTQSMQARYLNYRIKQQDTGSTAKKNRKMTRQLKQPYNTKLRHRRETPSPAARTAHMRSNKSFKPGDEEGEN